MHVKIVDELKDFFEKIKKDINKENIHEIRKEFQQKEKQKRAAINNLRDEEVHASFQKIKEQIKDFIAKKYQEYDLENAYNKLQQEPYLSSESEAYLATANPLSQGVEDAYNIMREMEYHFQPAPLVVSEEANFGFLHVDATHPSRKDVISYGEKLLRSHTTSFQKLFVNTNTPFKAFTIGKTFRPDHDSTHFPCFHQLDIFEIHDQCSVSYLHAAIRCFLQKFFKKDVKIEIKMSHFPFTIPSFEIYLGGVEVAGAGMVENKIVERCYAADKIGCAAGIGIDRLVMIRNNISDIRSFWAS